MEEIKYKKGIVFKEGAGTCAIRAYHQDKVDNLIIPSRYAGNFQAIDKLKIELLY